MIVIPEGLESDDIQQKYVQYQVIVIYCALSSENFPGTFSLLLRYFIVIFEELIGNYLGHLGAV